ncbi:acyl-CoA synthetase [Catenuloplanes atrovinosus]|uniref:Fatty-acyl-CoA synthase n=1 Tax=Catenuloplanes atrovinosus TaxID=137266 RepID=A0AAE4C8M8_9ACTN|nr:long-chain fatty acid--CoA ligase [Catenuloplanes atrovinosus]MDR7275696.1 fatty-acyl-CoA synthase [Catenuloplanes atrovinosus]
MRNEGVGSWAARRARMAPDRVALIHEGRSHTYGEVAARANALAHRLAGLGVGHGDRVAYLGPNHPAFLDALFATGLLGAVFVPLNTRLAAPELDYILDDCGARVLLWSPACEPTVTRLRAAARPVRLAGESTTDSAPVDVRVADSETCMIMYTSGTTGRPKGAMLTHANVSWNCVNLLIDVDLTSDEVTLVSAPMFHVAALNQTVLPTFLKGGACVLTGGFDPEATLDLIATHRVTCLFGVPAMFLAIARSPRFGTADLGSVRSMLCGGAPVPEPLIAAYQRRGLTFLQGYGMTECSPGALFLRAPESVRKAGSAGTPVFFGDVRVVTPGGEDAAPGETGEILVQGPSVMAGYWRLPAETRAALGEDGWLRTGDLAVTDADGFVYVRGRAKDLIISGGENIYPAEVEAALLDHPAVAECAVIGVPDERWGEVGRAFVVPAQGVAVEAAELLAFLDGRIARYKIPKSVVFVGALPRTGSGKVVKARLRAPVSDRREA